MLRTNNIRCAPILCISTTPWFREHCHLLLDSTAITSQIDLPHSRSCDELPALWVLARHANRQGVKAFYRPACAGQQSIRQAWSSHTNRHNQSWRERGRHEGEMSTPRDLLACARFRWLKPLRTSSSRPTLPVVAAPEKRAALRAARLKEVARGGSNHSTLWMEWIQSTDPGQLHGSQKGSIRIILVGRFGEPTGRPAPPPSGRLRSVLPMTSLQLQFLLLASLQLGIGLVVNMQFSPAGFRSFQTL